MSFIRGLRYGFLFSAFLWVVILLVCRSCYAEYDPKMEETYLAIILTEAAGEPFEGKVAVAETLRNRNWRTTGFSGVQRRDLKKFIQNNSRWKSDARHALRLALAGSNVSQGADHFENTMVYGVPKWAKGKRVVSVIGSHTFWR